MKKTHPVEQAEQCAHGTKVATPEAGNEEHSNKRASKGSHVDEERTIDLGDTEKEIGEGRLHRGRWAYR